MIYQKRRKRCYYCQKKLEPRDCNEKMLKNYLSMNGRIQSRERTNLCRKHQKEISKAIKHYRQMGLISH